MRFALLILTVMQLCACTSAGAPACASGMMAMKSELLYFGTASRNGPVRAEQWAEFLEEVVTPRFPGGLSVWPASGQWRSETGDIGREDSYVLNIVHSGSAVEEQYFEEIIGAYTARFQQEAVLRTQGDVCANL